MSGVRSHPERLDGRARVLGMLAEQGPMSRADLARLSALAPSTVSALVAELVADGIAVEATAPAPDSRNGRTGRPPVLVALDRTAGLVLGLDFGKRHIRVALCDLAHALVAEREQEVERDQPAAADIETAAALVEEVLADAGADRDSIVAVGAGIPGPVLGPTGELGDSTILPGWVGVTAAPALEAVLGLPVSVGNDANLGALAEWRWGAAQGHDDVAYIKAATGIGAGIIAGGRLLTGAAGTAGELGHTVVEPSGPICRCGNRGCLETIAGVPAILEALRPIQGELTIAEAIARAQDGDPGCTRAIADAGRAIGQAAATVCNLLNPSCLVIGGDLGAAGSIVIEPVREALARAVIRPAAQDVAIVQGAFADRAEVMGAIAFALRHARPLV